MRLNGNKMERILTNGNKMDTIKGKNGNKMEKKEEGL